MLCSSPIVKFCWTICVVHVYSDMAEYTTTVCAITTILMKWLIVFLSLVHTLQTKKKTAPAVTSVSPIPTPQLLYPLSCSICCLCLSSPSQPCCPLIPSYTWRKNTVLVIQSSRSWTMSFLWNKPRQNLWHLTLRQNYKNPLRFLMR